MRMRLLEKYNEFAKQCIPDHASALQRELMRQAFYAGAGAMYNLVYNQPAEVEAELGRELTKLLDTELRKHLGM